MTPGKTHVVACPDCKGQTKYMTIMSGNTFGAQVWSDGKRIAPMLPQPPAVTKCRHCGKCFWLADAPHVAALEPWSDFTSSTHEAEEPSELEYYTAIENGLAADSIQEKSLRIFSWWKANDPFRFPLGAQVVNTASAFEQRTKNMKALALLLQAGDTNDQIMNAEILRELGDFDSAKVVLKTITSPMFGSVVNQLRRLCERSDTQVRELDFSA